MPPPLPTPPPTERRPVQRLASIHSTTPGRRPQQKSTAQSKPNTCPNPSCPAPRIVDDDDKKVCTGCGTVLSDSNIVAEITFGESSSGAAVVQGTYVGADQSHGKTGLTTAEREELARLRKENRILQEERDILEKATAFFAKQSR